MVVSQRSSTVLVITECRFGAQYCKWDLIGSVHQITLSNLLSKRLYDVSHSLLVVYLFCNLIHSQFTKKNNVFFATFPFLTLLLASETDGRTDEGGKEEIKKITQRRRMKRMPPFPLPFPSSYLPILLSNNVLVSTYYSLDFLTLSYCLLSGKSFLLFLWKYN